MTCRRRKRFEKAHILSTVDSECTAVCISDGVVEVIQISNLESYMKIGYSKDCQLFSNRTVASVTDEIGKLETVEIEGHRVPFFRYSEVLLTFWESEAIGFEKCTDFFEKQIGIPFIALEFAQNGIWAFELVNQRDGFPLITVEVFGMGLDSFFLSFTRLVHSRGVSECSEFSEYCGHHSIFLFFSSLKKPKKSIFSLQNSPVNFLNFRNSRIPFSHTPDSQSRKSKSNTRIPKNEIFFQRSGTGVYFEELQVAISQYKERIKSYCKLSIKIIHFTGYVAYSK
ncbi:unnamed protein product [Caenorhabditis brenneri]